MTTIYALLRQRCGLSQSEAAAFHGVSEGSVASWDTGRRTVPAGVLTELSDLYAQIERTADAAVARALNAPDDSEATELRVAASDRDAQIVGLPCVAAQLASHGIAVARAMAAGAQLRLIADGA